MKAISKYGHRAITVAEDIGLIVIAISTVIAVAAEVTSMVGAGTVKLEDLLLLFIYLEVLAMVAMYLDSGQLPVRMPLYIAIVALARYMILDMKSLDNWRIIVIASAIFLVSLSVVVHRYGQTRFADSKDDKHRHGSPATRKRAG